MRYAMALMGLATVSCVGAVVLGWSLIVGPQQSASMRRVGVLMPLAQSDPEVQRRIAVFKEALQAHGWSEGRTIHFDVRYAGAKPEQLPEAAAEFVRANVDVIVTQAAQPIEAARKATSRIPIEMASVGDAVGGGYVASLARPGGNVTGQTLVATQQSAKRLALIKEILPSLIRVAVLWNPDASGHRRQLPSMEAAATQLGIEIQSFPMRGSEQLERIFEAAVQARAQAVLLMEDPMIQANRARIVELATRQRLPVMAEFRPSVAAGALMSYGANQVEMWRGAAAYVDRILKGADPATLPIARPIKYELVINLRTSKVLDLAIPLALQVAADEIIE